MIAIGITATDTDMGKTMVSGALAAAFNMRGLKAGVFKPAASGCVRMEDGRLLSTDADFLMTCAGIDKEEQSKGLKQIKCKKLFFPKRFNEYKV